MFGCNKTYKKNIFNHFTKTHIRWQQWEGSTKSLISTCSQQMAQYVASSLFISIYVMGYCCCLVFISHLTPFIIYRLASGFTNIWRFSQCNGGIHSNHFIINYSVFIRFSLTINYRAGRSFCVGNNHFFSCILLHVTALFLSNPNMQFHCSTVHSKQINACFEKRWNFLKLQKKNTNKRHCIFFYLKCHYTYIYAIQTPCFCYWTSMYRIVFDSHAI